MDKNDAAPYALRLPRSLKAEVENLSAQDGISMNQFIVMAVAEKVSALEVERFFEQRRSRANFSVLDRLLTRTGGESPREGDELDEIPDWLEPRPE